MNQNETPDQRLQRIKDTENQIAGQLRTLRPDVEIIASKYKTEFVYYTASVVKSEIVVSKHTRSIYIKDDASKLLKDKFLTQNEAHLAISKIMPKAKAKLKQCLDSYNQLTQDLGFYKGFNYDGDTHGIYNEFDYISFKIDDIDFQFAIND